MTDDVNPRADMFIRRMLAVLNEETLTKEQVYAKYMKLYPPSFIKKSLRKVLARKPAITPFQVDVYLKSLVEHEFVAQSTEPWRKGKSSHAKVMVYAITAKGRAFLSFKSSKK